MKLSDIKENDQQLDELLPGLATKAVGSLAKGVVSGTGVGGALAKAGKAVGMVPSATDLDDLKSVAADPAAAAQAAKDAAEKKKQIQDAIKQKQQELQDLQKQLAQTQI